MTIAPINPTILIMIKKISVFILFAAMFLFFTSFSVAAEVINPCPEQSTKFGLLCEFNSGTLTKIVRSGVKILFILAIILTLFFLIWGGIKWITSGGDKAQLETARNTMVAAAIGLILVFLSFLILNLILGFVGITGLNFIIPSLSD